MAAYLLRKGERLVCIVQPQVGGFQRLARGNARHDALLPEARRRRVGLLPHRPAAAAALNLNRVEHCLSRAFCVRRVAATSFCCRTGQPPLQHRLREDL